ncbi:hypothetical protein M569_02663, partial [Genlisea aurea]
ETSVSETPDVHSSFTTQTAEAEAFPSEGRRRRKREKLEVIICRMMSHRCWTTRLENSIRDLVPRFDNELLHNVLDGARKPQHALQFFRWVERSHLIQPDREAYLKIIETLGHASMLNHARCILLDMPKKGVEWDEDLWISMIASYGRAGIVQECVKLFQKMPEFGVKRTSKSYDTFLRAILLRGRYMMAKRYFNKMLNEGIEPTSHTFNILIWGFFLSRKLCVVKRFFQDMKARGITPDVITYSTMISGYFRVKRIEDAEKYFAEMKEMQIKPTVITYTALIKGYVDNDRIDDAMRMVEEMKGVGIKPNAVTYSTLLPGLCNADHISSAAAMLKEVVGKRITLKDHSIFMRLISSLCETSNLDAAANVLDSMVRLGVPAEPGHYGVLIKSFFEAGRYDEGVKLLDSLIEKDIVMRPENTHHLEPDSYNPMIEYLCSNGQTAKAEALFRQLMKLGVLDAAAFNALVVGHSREGAPASASEILRITARRSIPIERASYESVIRSYLDKNDPSEAKLALDGMIESGHLPDSSLYGSVMESLFDDGRVQTASRVMKTMLEKNAATADHAGLFGKITESLFVRGHVEEALGRVEMLMRSSGMGPDFDGLLSSLCEKGKTSAATKLLDFCVERDCTAAAVSSTERVLDALLAEGKTLNAYGVLCKVLGKGSGGCDWEGCKDLIRSLNEEGNTKQAEILSRMIGGGGSDKGGGRRKKKA